MINMYFENKYAKVYFDDSLDTVFLEYLGKVPSHSHFIEINQKVLDLFLENQTQKMVADIRYMGIISLESQQWVADVLLPGMIKHLNGKPLIHAQLLDEKDIMVKVSADGVKRKSSESNEGFQLHQFSDRQKLEEFLKGQV